MFRGTLSIIPAPDEEQLAIYSHVVYNNTPYTKALESIAAGKAGNPIPQKVGDPSPIKYVFYVLKENRTYDQVLGDMPEGNGDTSLVLFGEEITPNQHALAREFVLLDNFYVDGEVSAFRRTRSEAAATFERFWVSPVQVRYGEEHPVAATVPRPATVEPARSSDVVRMVDGRFIGGLQRAGRRKMAPRHSPHRLRRGWQV